MEPGIGHQLHQLLHLLTGQAAGAGAVHQLHILQIGQHSKRSGGLLHVRSRDARQIQLLDPLLQLHVPVGHGVGEGDLAISIIRQSALLQVDELGTKAAAVTQVAIKETAMEITEQPVEMYFDRPFFYMVYDMKEEIPLFMGIYDKPGES